MKKLITLIIVLILGSVGAALADDGSDTDPLLFTWEQDPGDLKTLTHWVLYESRTPGGPYTPFTQIDYVPGESEFKSEHEIKIEGNYGEAIPVYFVLVAFSKDKHSPDSNEVSHTFNIPEAPVVAPSVPMNFTVTVRVNGGASP